MTTGTYYQPDKGPERSSRTRKRQMEVRFIFIFGAEEEEEEFNRLPWLGQGGRAAAGCVCTAAVLRC
jgi:hypothetical protein